MHFSAHMFFKKPEVTKALHTLVKQFGYKKQFGHKQNVTQLMPTPVLINVANMLP